MREQQGFLLSWVRDSDKVCFGQAFSYYALTKEMRPVICRFLRVRLNRLVFCGIPLIYRITGKGDRPWKQKSPAAGSLGVRSRTGLSE